MSLIFPYNFSGDRNITVYKSVDFEPLTYTVGNTTYYCPRVTFDGNADGKIVAIKAIDADGRFRSFEPSMLLHFGSNVFEPFVYGTNSGNNKGPHTFNQATSDGITVKYLSNGGYRITGTATKNGNVIIGRVWFAFINSDCNVNNSNLVLSCDIRGNYIYEGLKIGNSSAHDNNQDISTSLPITNFVANSNLGGGNYSDIYITYLKGATFDCIIYPTISMNVIDMTSVSYERPFVSKSISGLIQEKYGIPSHVTTASSSGSSSHSHNVYLDPYPGNASNFGIIDYPIIHTGKNNFVYTYGSTDPNNLLNFEIYYDSLYHIYNEKKIKDEINDIEYSISNGRINKPIISLFATYFADYSSGLDNHYAWYASHYITSLSPRSPYLPNGVYLWWKYSSSNPFTVRKTVSQNEFKERYNWLTSESFCAQDNGFPVKKYVPRSDFIFENNINWGQSGDSYLNLYMSDAVGLPINPYTSTSASGYYSRLIFDYDGFDDSVTYSEEEEE